MTVKIDAYQYQRFTSTSTVRRRYGTGVIIDYPGIDMVVQERRAPCQGGGHIELTAYLYGKST